MVKLTSAFKLFFFIVVASVLSGCSKHVDTVSLQGSTMGTTYHIKYVPNNKTPDIDTLHAEVELTLEQVNDQMSTYRPDSELSTYNRLKEGQGIKVSPDLLTVIKEAKKINKISDGALDITVGPLVNLWGFGPRKGQLEAPKTEQVAAARKRVNINGVVINGERLEKGSKDLYADLSSIAKGFGVDKVSAIFEKYHVSGYLVEIGGELRIKGKKADGSGWKVAIEKPTSDERKVQQVIAPGDMAMATSGDYRNYFEENGKRYNHIIDPRTGMPVQHRLASVTVLNKECMVADGYATAMIVLGVKDSLALAKKQNLAIMLIEKQDNGFKVHYSDAFKKYVKE
ncbi:FAD:protein FMN transferase [Shewanella sp. 202IG2-18]|uniref:FAD:protein FMN transferase n=1 Tax=Parashewanella hymeniacidonis TaxID=2807618 RepID=UPI001961120D|nr:FAD:protein FMN transferase [Parashewanella hymeniacidonis]MBM7070806.1 FAD:protein FMN transferase [Parashewanella hymeniacidonis]